MTVSFDGPRYLVAFGPKRVPHCFTDVLVLGGGVAGLRAALAVDPRLSVTIVTKDDLLTSSSQWAQGGIAGVVDPEDKFDNHVSDTIEAGGGLCHEEVVDAVVREAPRHISELIDWGTRFDARDGALDLGREGGHSHHRIVHALGDATGREVMRAIIERARETTSRGASSARGSKSGMNRRPSLSTSQAPAPRTASVIRLRDPPAM